MDAEAGADGGVAVAEDVPGEAEAGLGEEFGVVGGEGAGADGGVGGDDAVGEGVDGGAALRFVQAGGGFDADAGADFEARGELMVSSR